jgi:hypothetical protein
MKSARSLYSPKVTRKHIKSASQIKPPTTEKPIASRKFQFNFGSTASVTKKTNYVLNRRNPLFGVSYNPSYHFFSKSVVSPVNAVSSNEASGVVHAYSGATTNGLFR